MATAILICDDEPEIRKLLKRTLSGFEIAEAGSPREALDVMKKRSFDAVVSDYSMHADSDGLDLLQLVKLQYPETVRFLVTANRDLDVALRAVNEGAVHRFFLKPWDDDKLRAAMEIVLRSKRSATGA